MTKHPEPRDPVSTGMTVAAVVGAIACCAVPLLVAAGVLTAAGAVLRNLLIIAVGAGMLGWAITRVVHTLRACDRSARPTDRTRT